MKHFYRRCATILSALLCIASADTQASSKLSSSIAIYPALFDTGEIYSGSIDRFYKWTGMLQRWTAEREAARAPCALGQNDGCEPREWHRLVELLKPLDLRAKVIAVNAVINRYPYVSSTANWHESNHWETPFEFLARSGQCQDYAIAKFMLLRAAGVPNDVLRVAVVRDTHLALDHAVLVAYVDGQALMLDNQIPEVVAAASVHHYQPYYSINETGWWLHEPNPLQITSVDLH